MTQSLFSPPCLLLSSSTWQSATICSLLYFCTHHSQQFQSHYTDCGGVRQPLPSFAHFLLVSLSQKCYHCLILAVIIPALDVTALSYPASFSSQIECCAAGDRANVPQYCRCAVVCKLNCKAYSLPHHSTHMKTKGNDSPIVIYYLAPSVFDHKQLPEWWSCRLGLFLPGAPLKSFAFIVVRIFCFSSLTGVEYEQN